MADPKPAVDGTVDDLLLGDGFSIVDSTKGDVGDQQPPATESIPTVTTKKRSPTAAPTEKAPTPPKEKPSERVTVEAKEEAKVNGHDAKSDALLITTEEDLELTEREKRIDQETDITGKRKPAVEKRKQGDVWVSNITRHVKATDLKKHFTRHGKVLTAKIVTNGKSFFGYILMEGSEVANRCVRALHGSLLDGRKITVSRQRPDQRRSMTERKTATVKAAVAKVVAVAEKKPGEEEKREEALVAARRSEDRLRREVDYLRREMARVKRFLSDEQRRVRIEQQKNRTLGRELQEAETKLREERRKFDRERELFEKNQRTDRMKMETDRTMIKKELEEVKKLREYLKRKLEEEQARPVERRPRAGSPYAYSSKRFRESASAAAEKGSGSKYAEERTRTPPSPPKLSSRSSKRSPVGAFGEKERRGHHYGGGLSEREEVGGRHHGGGGSMVMAAKPSTPAAPRNIWPSFHQEVWRMPPGAGTSTAFAASGQSYTSSSRQGGGEYNSTSSSSKGGAGYSQQREFSKRDHYNSSSVRKY